MPVADRVRIDPGDRAAVDKMADRDQHFAEEVEADGMASRQVKVLRRAGRPEGAGSDPDRKAGTPLGVRRKSTSVWPIHLIGRVSPEAVTTRSPTSSASTATSPPGVQISVPAAKQMPTIVLL